ncbi:hypothetical protein [Methylobacterium brachiatum]|uniref:hypothetical protein n=1 Tax=Methylobacterium brachiatum TaxID=269660 RepID=UPI000EFD837A|nr:hypothetical protein [Methylobacterium brachiatum]AYO83608.1 hypothetical protein EBB05_15920 [Methylobacterium brachiatum]
MAADIFAYRTNGLFFDVYNVRTGEVVEELIDCTAEAINYRDEYQARANELEAEEIAAAQAAAKDELIDHVQDFLRALDRGHLGEALRFRDGTESAYVAALRTAVAPFERRA